MLFAFKLELLDNGGVNAATESAEKAITTRTGGNKELSETCIATSSLHWCCIKAAVPRLTIDSEAGKTVASSGLNSFGKIGTRAFCRGQSGKGQGDDLRDSAIASKVNVYEAS
jgi:hypothetical protein